MTHVHYKFSSKLSYDTVLFDGPHITLRDLKRQIMGRERLRAGDCDLQITNAQSKEEYTDDEGLIPKGSSVIVRRIPVCGGKSSSNAKTKNIESSAVSFHHTYGAAKAMDEQSSSRALPFLAKMANLAEADVSEEDKIRVMLNQSTYDAMNYNKRFGSGLVLPPNYTCYRCGNAGHHIRSCPATGQDKNFEAPVRIRKSTGIPRSFMVEVDDPSMKGAMLTSTGRYAIPAIDAEAYAIGKKEKPPFIPQEKPASEAEEDPVPDELLCLICRDLLSDAVVIPCCGNSYCDDCIRTTLLDSEEHVCPTCSQSEVSPDTLIANKFLRQAVNNFKKERGYTNTLKTRCGASQSQNPKTTRSSPVTTPPPLTGQNQPQKPLQPSSSQQHQPHVADPRPVSEAPPAATGLASACSTPGTSTQPEQTGLENHNKTPEEKTDDDSAAAPSVLASNNSPSPAPSQQIPVVNHTAAAEQPETVCVKQQQSSSCLSAAPSPCGPPTSWDSSSFSSSSAHPSRGWTETQQLLSAATPPLFPSPIFLSPQQSHPSFPPGYQPTTPLWPAPSPHGTPIPSLCSSMATSSIPSLSSSTSASFIPSLIPDEWYRHQRKKNERGTSYKDPAARSKSYKSKSSRSYSNSSSRSRSRSRSRSKSRSRHQSPYSHHRSLHTRSHAFSSYSYGYKCSRSPTPSSSSSPRVSHSSRSKSPSDHQRKRHHSRHQNKKSSSSRYGSRRRGERSVRETGSSEASLASPLSAPQRSQSSSLDLERERYLQWKKDYKEWCEKYFSSYVGHFHQLPLPLLNLPPPPQWEDTARAENSSRAKPDSGYQPQGRCPTSQDGHSPSLRSSSASRSPPSHSLSDSRSTPSQSFSDSGSSPSHTSSNSRSPPLRPFSDSLFTPSEDRAQMGHSPTPKGTEEVNLQKINKADKKVNVKHLEGLDSLKHDQRRPKSHREGREGKRVSLTRDEWLRDTGPNACKDTGFPAHDKETISGYVKSVQPYPRSSKYLDEHHERESREKRWRTGKHSDTRQNEDRRRKAQHSKERDRRDADQYRSRKHGKSAETKPEKSRRRKGEEAERNQAQRKSVSPKPAGRNKPNNDKKDPKKQALTESQIWEDGMKVAPQKKKINININLNLDGKRKEFDLLSAAKKANEENERTGNGEEGEGEARKEDVAETSKTWEKGTFREVKVWEEKRKGEGFDFWHCGLRGGEEEKEEEEEEGGGCRSKPSKEEVTRDEEVSKTGNESHSQEISDLIQNAQEEEPDGEDVFSTNRETALDEFNSNTRQELTQGEDPTMPEERVSPLQRPEAAAGHGSICEDRQQRRKTLEENPRETDPGREEAPLHIKVPLSRWDKGSEEAESMSERTAQDALAVSVPPPLVVTAKQETEEKRWRSVDPERDRDQQMPRRRLHNDSSLPGINRAVAPSSGRHQTDSTMYTDGDRERKMEMERYRDGERSRERQKESKRPKDQRREEERGRYHNKRDPPASGSSSSTSRDTERRDWQRGGGQGSERRSLHPKDRSSVSTAVEVPDKSAYKAQSHASADSKSKDIIQRRNCPDQRDSSCNYTHVPSDAQGRDRDPLSSKSFSPNPRASSQEEGGEWGHSKAPKGVRESKQNRETGEKEADGGGGRRWDDINPNNIWAGESVWRQRRELQEEEGSSSYSCSSASLEEESRRQRKERRAAVPQHLEQHELQRHKKSKTNPERGGEKSGAEVEGGGSDRMAAPGRPDLHG